MLQNPLARKTLEIPTLKVGMMQLQKYWGVKKELGLPGDFLS